MRMSSNSVRSGVIWLLGFLWRASPPLMASWCGVALLAGLTEVASLWAIHGTVSALVDASARGNSGAVSQWLVLLIAAFVAEQVAQVCQPYLRERMRIATGYSIQAAALEKMGRLSVETFEQDQTHDVISRVAAGTDQRGPDLVSDLLAALALVPALIASVVALAYVAPWLPVLLILGQGILIWYSARAGSATRQFEVDFTADKRLADYYAGVMTTRSHASELRLWDLKGEVLRRWESSMGSFLANKLRTSVKNALGGVGIGLGFVMLVPGALFVVGLLGITVTAGIAAIVLTALRNVTAGIYQMKNNLMRFAQNAGYAADVRHLLETMRPEDEGREGIHTNADFSKKDAKDAKDAVVKNFPRPIRSTISLQGVCYRYPGAERDALSNINLDIHSGEVIALVGANGAGKTTLANMLIGLRRPSSGYVLIDGIDLADVELSEIRRNCVSVFQQPMRYPDTVKENICLGTPRQPQEIEQAIRAVGLNDRKFGLDDFLSPEFGGIDLSGGEWQRIAVTRALLHQEAQIMVFDEPTAALDPLAELELFGQFSSLICGRTTILISHRLGPTRLAHRVVVLAEGKIVEQGSPSELLAAGGVFSQMYEAQARWYS